MNSCLETCLMQGNLEDNKATWLLVLAIMARAKASEQATALRSF